MWKASQSRDQDNHQTNTSSESTIPDNSSPQQAQQQQQQQAQQQQQQQAQQPPMPQTSRRSSKLGPPKYIRPRPYPQRLEQAENKSNAILITEYEDDVYDHFVTLEQLSKIDPKMIDLQPEVEWYMRPYLLDFLIEMHTSFKLKPQTLFLCMNIIDRYCAKRIVFKQHYQLIGCTAMWMAAKYEDKKSRVPTLRELSLMCRNVYDECMFKEMEMHMLSTIEWSLAHISLEDCLQLSLRIAKNSHTNDANIIKSSSEKKAVDNAIIAIGRYLCELSLFQRSFLLYPTSLIAITAHLIASAIINDGVAAQSLTKLINDYDTANGNTFNFKQEYQNNRTNKNGTQNDQIDFDDLYEDDEEEDDDEEDDEDMYDEDLENTKPSPTLPFISGFEGDKTVNQIRQLSLLFVNAINNPSEILVNKYTPLGVIGLVNGYLNKNYNFLQHSINMLNFKDIKIDELSIVTISQLHQLTDLLLGLSTMSAHSSASSYYNAMQPPSSSAPFTSHSSGINSSPPPLTPTSATSSNASCSSSVFSSGAKTPNANTFSLSVPHSNRSYHHHNQHHQQQMSKGQSQSQSQGQEQRKKINYPNSSPVADLPCSSPPINYADIDDDDDMQMNHDHHDEFMNNRKKFQKPIKPASYYNNTNISTLTTTGSDDGPVSSPLAVQHHHDINKQNSLRLV